MTSKIYNKLIIGAFLMLLTSLPVAAEGFFDDVEMKARLGYSIGGTAPLGMPASIRSIEAFHVTPNFQIGFDVAKPLSGQWGVQTGLMLKATTPDACARRSPNGCSPSPCRPRIS